MLTWQIGETRCKDATGLGSQCRLVHVVARGIGMECGQGRLERARDAATWTRLTAVAIIVGIGAIGTFLRFTMMIATFGMVLIVQRWQRQQGRVHRRRVFTVD